MANAKKCDRCGAFYDIKENPILSIERTGTPYINNKYSKYIDLCPQCLEELKQWLNLKKSTKK